MVFSQWRGDKLYWSVICLKVLPTENKMSHPSHAKVLLAGTFTAVVWTYTAFGAFGYLVYGSAIEDSITLNLTGNTIVTIM